MRKMIWTLAAAVLLTACSEDTAAPGEDVVLLDDAAALAFGAMDMADPGSHFIARLNSLPDSIKLSPAQQEQIRALLNAYRAAIAADLQALAAIHQEARAAHQAGKSPAEIRAILAKGDAIRARLHAAEAKLHADLRAVLTPAQLAWLSSPPPAHPCRNVTLTDAQKTQITALIAAFETANQADLDAIKAVFEEARAAHQAGATREQIAAILAKARAPMERVRAARQKLDADIRALLTPEQLRCFGGAHR